MRRPISSWHPLCYRAVVFLRCAERRWAQRGVRFARETSATALPFRVYKHQSVLIRRLGDTDRKMQENKVVNLRLAIETMDGILIRPGETFSVWRLVGKPTSAKGYLEGMVLSGGEARAGVGGGLCQIANLIHWLAIHSPLTVSERHHHSFDPFPDDGRVVPFGCGATIMYNYVDYQLRNDTERTFQLRFWLDNKCINGDMRIDEALPYTYHVFELNHRFLLEGGAYYRENEIWRRKVKKIGSGDVLETECLAKHRGLVKYVPAEFARASENTVPV